MLESTTLNMFYLTFDPSGVHTGGRSMLSPGSHLPPNAIALEGTLVIPGSADLKSHAKQYLSGTSAGKV